MASILAALSVWVVSVTTQTPAAKLPPRAAAVGTPSPAAPATVPRVPTRDDLLRPSAPRFGISAPRVPWSASMVDSIARLAGRRPTMLEYFVNWRSTYDATPVRLAYQQGAVPVLSWEPWAGERAGPDQPPYTLRRIASGGYDRYVTAFATAVRNAKWPVVMRFAHEMNGNWYPWSEQRSGNQPGDYVRAWRHVHDVFARVGATNVIWVWSPNIIRPVPDIDLTSLFPGPAYVDWVGLVGYGVRERGAGITFDPTISEIRRFTTLPLLITETGARPGPDKTRWTSDFFRWLAHHLDVVGFIWFQYGTSDGGTSDWRFNSDPQCLAAFTAGLAKADLAEPVVISG